MSESITMAGKAILITGANRGIGQALLEEALRRGASRVYAGVRGSFTHPDERVMPLLFDVTDAAQIEHAAQRVTELDVLINNAGISSYDDLADLAVIEQHLAVNLFGLHSVTQAFVPLLIQSRGAIVNNISLAAIAPLPVIPAYSVSKAAVASLTQSQRALLASKGVRVHAVFTGPTDTDMNRGFDIPKTPAPAVAQAIFDGVENQDEDIFPDPVSQGAAAGWTDGPVKKLEREFAASYQA